jgi:hypothetical protein
LVIALLVCTLMYDMRAGRSGEPLTDHNAEAAARGVRESSDLYGGMTPGL